MHQKTEEYAGKQEPLTMVNIEGSMTVRINRLFLEQLKVAEREVNKKNLGCPIALVDQLLGSEVVFEKYL